jgi:hypothetical protein
MFPIGLVDVPLPKAYAYLNVTGMLIQPPLHLFISILDILSQMVKNIITV